MIRIVWNNLIPPGFTHEKLIDSLISPAIFYNPELTDKISQSSFYKRKIKTRETEFEIDFPTDLKEHKTTMTRLFSYQKESSSIARRMMSLLLTKTEHNSIQYNMDTFPVRRVFKEKWKEILSTYSNEDITFFKEYIKLFGKKNTTPKDFKKQIEKWGKTSRIKPQLIDVDVTFQYKGQDIILEDLIYSITTDSTSSNLDIDNDPSYEAKKIVEEKLFYEKLATLSVIACVWYLWEEAKNNSTYAEQIVRLAKMIFPTKQIKSDFDISVVSNTETEDTRLAKQELKEAEAFLKSRQYQQAGEICERIFEIYKNASDQVIATALARLVECCENDYPRPRRFASIDDIKKEAVNYNCIYISKKRNSIKIHPNPAKMQSVGRYTLNCDNHISKWIENTAPIDWEKIVSTNPVLTLSPNMTQYIILISDDFEKNMHDALSILDYIKRNTDEKTTTVSDWENLILYIRCNEDEFTPLLDTALSFFTENTKQDPGNIFSMIHIYLIDEAKRSAEFLFAKHPHFYPLTFAHSTFEENKTINLVIVSNNPDQRYLKWLIKEGFWTLPRFDTSITTKITVISPFASEVGYSITTECPGLEGFSIINEVLQGKPIDIDDITFPTINFVQTSFTNHSLHNALKMTFSENAYLYYVIDAESDLKGIQLGTTIRELAIRKAVASGRINNYSKKDYIIAIRCMDPDYATLTQELIIPKEEEHANSWFNDYNFITWGSIADLFSWEQLNGGIVETLAQCIHLQYCKSSYKKEDCKKHLVSYFKRIYNHDSSFAAALSLPYRMYEADVLPRAWFIQNPDAWWNKEVREEIAKKYNEKLFSYDNKEPDKLLLERLSKYEHMRWCCYQLTRGWLPVQDTRMIQYMAAGVSRHTLQIAKLHPCICSWEDLKYLKIALSNAATRKISSSDYNNFLKIKEESTSEFKSAIEPYLDKKFEKYFSVDDDFSFFQNIDIENIKQTANILEAKWFSTPVHTSEEKSL